MMCYASLIYKFVSFKENNSLSIVFVGSVTETLRDGNTGFMLLSYTYRVSICFLFLIPLCNWWLLQENYKDCFIKKKKRNNSWNSLLTFVLKIFHHCFRPKTKKSTLCLNNIGSLYWIRMVGEGGGGLCNFTVKWTTITTPQPICKQDLMTNELVFLRP